MKGILLVFVAGFLFSVLVIGAPADIVAYCWGVHSQYNLASHKSSYFTCNLTVNFIEDYVYAAVFISACTVTGWPTYEWEQCIPSPDCGCRWDEGSAPCVNVICNNTIPPDWTYLGDMETRVQYWGIDSGSQPFYSRSINNFSIINDPSVTCPPLASYGQNAYCSCVKGTYGNGTSCVPCPPGTYGLTEGLETCTPCAVGHYGGGGSTACTAAPVGYYVSEIGAVHSTACAPGTYAPTTASSECLICPNGTYSCAAASKCTSCSAGRYSLAGSSFCIACPPGTYAPAGASSCTPCPPNTYSSTLAATSSSSCTLCPSGKTLLPGCTHSQYCCV